jgi:hypothetical protein
MSLTKLSLDGKIVPLFYSVATKQSGAEDPDPTTDPDLAADPDQTINKAKKKDPFLYVDKRAIYHNLISKPFLRNTLLNSHRVVVKFKNLPRASKNWRAGISGYRL